MTVIVFGSINMDLVAKTPRLPCPGETLMGDSFITIPGGKGANQAVAIARLGISTEIVGRVGDDRFGQELLASLRASGVGCDRVLQDSTTHSGVAMIVVDAAAENQILVISGANGQVNITDSQRLNDLLPAANALLLQLEIPLVAVLEAAQAAKSAGVLVILDPAPVPTHWPDELYSLIDILTPNQIEASQLVGFEVNTFERAATAAEVLHQRGVSTVIVKLGSQGALCSPIGESPFRVPAFAVEAIDTVAAGDAFNGGLAAALAEGLPLQQATRWGAATAALSVMKTGAQSSMPSRAELEAFLAEH
ncbi:MAG: ribokinase [Oculatellaceae cyanobacterium bins.114]|nr:ribokinase [Oculatellaceae cyanobacterium bins.114]